MSDKSTEFFYYKRNGLGPTRLEMLEEHYSLKAAAYRQKGMHREAELFAKMVEELKQRETKFQQQAEEDLEEATS